MIYEFKCDDCSAVEEIERSVKEGPPSQLPCSCGGIKHRVWMDSTTIIIPEYMRAEGTQDFSTWKTRMAKSRPSGREKVFY